MAEKSTIEWTDATWNPITGCTLMSEGCRHCYAATLAATRLKNHPSRAGLARINAAGEAKFTSEVRLNEGWLDQPLRWKRPRRIFVCAHGDLFHEAVPDEWIDRVFAVMALAPRHTFQVLTKRPERAREYLSEMATKHIGWSLRPLGAYKIYRRAEALASDLGSKYGGVAFAKLLNDNLPDNFHKLPDVWPLPNVWLGTSIEDQATADARIPPLLETPASVRFVSAEPLLGPVDLSAIKHVRYYKICALSGYLGTGMYGDYGPRLDLVIVGGESGKNARPMHPDWARSLRDQCVSAEVPFFFKQWGEWVSVSEVEGQGDHFRFPDGATVRRTGKALAGRTLNGRTWDQMPAQKGGA